MLSPTLLNSAASTPARHWRDELDQHAGGFSVLADADGDENPASGPRDRELDAIFDALDA